MSPMDCIKTSRSFSNISYKSTLPVLRTPDRQIRICFYRELSGFSRAMRRWLLIFLAMTNGAMGAEPLKVIFDTDIDGDNDDVAAAAILHAFADEGRVQILAMGVVSRFPDSPACLDAINTYYGRGDIPIGV